MGEALTHFFKGFRLKDDRTNEQDSNEANEAT